ncbi:33908_t:CDS:2, partial [Gigaspora margarita]
IFEDGTVVDVEIVAIVDDVGGTVGDIEAATTIDDVGDTFNIEAATTIIASVDNIGSFAAIVVSDIIGYY